MANILNSPIAAAGVSAGGSLLGSVIGGLFGNYSQKKANEQNQLYLAQQFEYNRRLQEQEYQQNLAQWNLENEYNSPSEQMARLAAAGINPHLAYSNGSVSNVSARSPQYSAPSYGLQQSAVPDTSGYINAGQRLFSDIVAQMMNSSLLGSQKDLNDARALSVLASVPGIEADSTFKVALSKFADRLASNNMQMSDFDVIQKGLRNKLIQAQTGLTESNILRVEELTESLGFDNTVKGATLQNKIYMSEIALSTAWRDLENKIKDGRLKDVTERRILAEIRKLDFMHGIGYSTNDWLKIASALYHWLKDSDVPDPFDARDKVEKSNGPVPMPISPLR